MMRSVILCLVITSVFAAFVLSENNDEEMEAEYVNELLGSLDFVEKDDLRSDDDDEDCIARDHDCTSHRHRCCRSELFKDTCKCFYVEGNDTEVEVCTCQQEWYKGMTETLYNTASNFLSHWFG